MRYVDHELIESVELLSNRGVSERYAPIRLKLEEAQYIDAEHTVGTYRADNILITYNDVPRQFTRLSHKVYTEITDYDGEPESTQRVYSTSDGSKNLYHLILWTLEQLDR